MLIFTIVRVRPNVRASLCVYACVCVCVCVSAGGRGAGVSLRGRRVMLVVPTDLLREYGFGGWIKQANPRRLVSNLSYITAFHSRNHMKGEMAYFLMRSVRWQVPIHTQRGGTKACCGCVGYLRAGLLRALLNACRVGDQL